MVVTQVLHNIFNNLANKLIFFIILVLFSSTLSAEEKPHAPDVIQGTIIVNAEEVIDLILNNPDLIVIDARKKTEFVKGHIEGAINMLNTKMEAEDLEKVAADKSRAILFYCNGTRCMRSADAIRKAKSWGYTNLIWFRGGWKEWTDKRLPVVTE
jgi:rhodanese-related sulfurtransferase